MASLPQPRAFTLEFFDEGVTVEISFSPLVLRLRHQFGTSHSSTTVRHNALFTCTLKTRCAPQTHSQRPTLDVLASEQRIGSERNVLEESVTGFGEAGLPPKKPKCYLASVEDCGEFVDQLEIRSRTTKCLDTTQGVVHHDPLDWVRRETRMSDFGRAAKDQNEALYRVCGALLRLVDETASRPEDRAAKSGVEAAILDAWCKALRVPFYEFCVGGVNPTTAAAATAEVRTPRTAFPCRSFYTSALNDDVEDMIESARFGLTYTPCLKIKLNDDVVRCVSILERFLDLQLGRVLSLDANAAWSIDVAEEYARRIEHLITTGRLVGGDYHDCQNPSHPDRSTRPALYMIEQPFPVDYVPGADVASDARWIAFRRKMNALGVLVYGDESIATVDDVVTFHRSGLVDGVNVKLEKAGGIRASLHAASVATELGLRVWIGTMVSTCLGCSQAAQVAVAAAQDCDADGGLLTFPDHFTGGFSWRPSDGGAVIVAGMLLTTAEEVPRGTAGTGCVGNGDDGTGADAENFGFGVQRVV